MILMMLWPSFKQPLACFVVYGMMDGAIASSMNALVLSTLTSKQKSQGIGYFHLSVAIALVAGPPFGGTVCFGGGEGGSGMQGGCGNREISEMF